MIRRVDEYYFRIICDEDFCDENVVIFAEHGWEAYQEIKEVGWAISAKDFCRKHMPAPARALVRR